MQHCGKLKSTLPGKLRPPQIVDCGCRNPRAAAIHEIPNTLTVLSHILPHLLVNYLNLAKPPETSSVSTLEVQYNTHLKKPLTPFWLHVPKLASQNSIFTVHKAIKFKFWPFFSLRLSWTLKWPSNVNCPNFFTFLLKTSFCKKTLFLYFWIFIFWKFESW